MTTDYKKKDIFYLGLDGNDVNKLFTIEGKLSLSDTSVAFDRNYKIYLINKSSGDTLDVGYPNKYTGLYGFSVAPGEFRLDYTGPGYFTQSIDTAILQVSSISAIGIDITLLRDPSFKSGVRQTIAYDKIDPTLAPSISAIDSSILIRNMNVNDLGDNNINDSDVLYYTVQVIALYNPVDVSYFKYIADMKVMYNDIDKFYRYTTGKFSTREEAYNLIQELKRKGYPEDMFVKKVSKQ